MDEVTVPQADPAQALRAGQQRAWQQQANSGVSWFFWIAGLSIINTVVYLFEGGMTFVIGLGLTQVVDGVAKGLVQGMSANAAGVAQAAALVLDLVVAGVFVLYGVMGRRKVRWAVIAGMILYTLDGVIYIIVGDWLPLAFHVLALVYLGRGVLAMNKLIALEKPLVSAAGLSPYPQAGAFDAAESRLSSGMVLNVVAILGTLLLVLLTGAAFVLLLLN